MSVGFDRRIIVWTGIYGLFIAFGSGGRFKNHETQISASWVSRKRAKADCSRIGLGL